LPVQAQNEKIKWNPECRHQALYWAITVIEQYPTRIKYGYFMDANTGEVLSYHVQPQVKIGDNWYYFKVEDESVVVILFDMNEWTGDNPNDVWVPKYTYYDFSEYVKQMKKWREEK
jgi:hypothetical protein